MKRSPSPPRAPLRETSFAKRGKTKVYGNLLFEEDKEVEQITTPTNGVEKEAEEVEETEEEERLYYCTNVYIEHGKEVQCKERVSPSSQICKYCRAGLY